MKKKAQRRFEKREARKRWHDENLESKNVGGKQRFIRPGSNKK